MTTLDKAALVLLIIGGLNWGLVGLFEFDLVAALFGELSAFSRLVYVLIGLSAIYVAVKWRTFTSRAGTRPHGGAEDVRRAA